MYLQWAGGVCGWVCPRYLEIACIDPHQTGFVGKGSDRLQLIQILAVPRPREGVCGWAKIFGSALLQPTRSVCVSLSDFFFHFSVHRLQLADCIRAALRRINYILILITVQ